MKKIAIFIALIIPIVLILSTSFFSVEAAPGCCSGHDGVNCKAGADVDGSVICSDGWRNSSCLYSEIDKCKVNNPSNNSLNRQRTTSSSYNSLNKNTKETNNSLSVNKAGIRAVPYVVSLVGMFALGRFASRKKQ